MIKITPTILKGKVQVPPSKSMAHRAVICASLSSGTSIISNIDNSDDIIATITAMKSLGAIISQDGDTLTITGVTDYKLSKDKLIDCNESGSTLRFLVPISMMFCGKLNFVGTGNLGKRPLTPFYEIFDAQNIEYSYEVDKLDLKINGNLHSDTFRLRGDISSQFISGLLFALPLLENDSKIIITSPLQSKGYIDLTLQMINHFGVEIENQDYTTFIIKGSQSYKATKYNVEGDFSQAAFYFVAGALGNAVTVTNMNINSLQADKVILEFLEQIGADITINQDEITVSKNRLEAIDIDGSECPDIIPIISVALALCKGKSTITNVARLRIKECDRLEAISTLLNKIGGNVKEFSDNLIIEGINTFDNQVQLSSYKDHRIAMSIAIATTMSKKPILLENPECVSKSYPHFWEDYIKLNGMISEVSK
ncbi:MAG: 3-phosphoshikimate 1-carboxyvinyltransferase [Epulopiscium sp. Nuni2H_MBin003]|nr:MAG: 3-phosphoshikimate 1-carboxyvinyltransferase [Epulopiscium sp. Nuni2H_MBin003]